MKVPKVFWGLGDSGLSAAGTFVAGVVAVATFGTHELALYSLLFSGSLLAMLLPQQMAYLPSRITANTAGSYGVPSLRLDLRGALPATLLAVLVVGLAGAPMFGSVPSATAIPMVLWAALMTAVVPLQTHLRACLHIAGRHPQAATVSALSTATIVLLATQAPALGSGTPFLALGVGNVVSSVLAVALMTRLRRVGGRARATFRARISYLVSDASVQAAWYLASLIVVAVLGASALAALEAARVASAPVFVLVNGFASFMIPAAIRSLQLSQLAFLRQIKRMIVSASAGGLIYSAAVLAIAPLMGFLLDRHIPAALASARALASTVEGASNSLASPMYARGFAGRWVAVTVLSLVVTLVTLPLLLLSPLGVFAMPVAQATGMLVRCCLGWSALRRP
jgi:hypothetical protein